MVNSQIHLVRPTHLSHKIRGKGANASAAGMSAIGKPTHHGSSFAGGGDKIQSLRVWEPPSFCMAFFWYVPLSTISYLFNDPLDAPALHILSPRSSSPHGRLDYPPLFP
jgi:hypothetical protein